jgi:hypothetical protein
VSTLIALGIFWYWILFHRGWRFWSRLDELVLSRHLFRNSSPFNYLDTYLLEVDGAAHSQDCSAQRSSYVKRVKNTRQRRLKDQFWPVDGQAQRSPYQPDTRPTGLRLMR